METGSDGGQAAAAGRNVTVSAAIDPSVVTALWQQMNNQASNLTIQASTAASQMAAALTNINTNIADVGQISPIAPPSTGDMKVPGDPEKVGDIKIDIPAEPTYTEVKFTGKDIDTVDFESFDIDKSGDPGDFTQDLELKFDGNIGEAGLKDLDAIPDVPEPDTLSNSVSLPGDIDAPPMDAVALPTAPSKPNLSNSMNLGTAPGLPTWLSTTFGTGPGNRNLKLYSRYLRST
jgi:hypothetical protein